MKKVLYIQPLHPAGMKLLEEEYQVFVANNEDPRYLKSIISQYHAVVTRLTTIDAEMIENGRNLEAIAKHGVGTDNIDVEAAKKRGIAIVTTGDANSRSVAEHAVFAMGALCKRIPYLDNAVRNGNWLARDESGSSDLSGKQVGIVGFGRIGARVAEMVSQGFGAKARVYDPFAEKVTIEAKGYEYTEDLRFLCQNADFLTVHAPLTEATRNLINYDLLSIMKPTAFVINFARGGVINEADLRRALEEQKIAGAALDAFEQEPLGHDSPLLKLDHVILSPHCGTFSEDSKRRMSIAVAQGIMDILG